MCGSESTPYEDDEMLVICACCSGKGGHPVHYHGGPRGGWRIRPCVLCESTGQVEGSEANRPGDDVALLVLRRKCADSYYGAKEEQATP